MIVSDIHQFRGNQPTRRGRLGGALVAAAATAAIAAIAAIAGLSAQTGHVGGGQADESARPGPPGGPRAGLIVQVTDGLVPQARVRGVLDVDTRGCVRLDGLLLIAPVGSEVLDDASGVAVPGIGAVGFGTTVEGSGGITPSPRDGDVSDPRGCVRAGAGAPYLILHP